MGDEPAVVALARSEAAGAARMLARAFDEDPLFVAISPDDKRRELLLSRMFAALIRTTYAAHGAVTTPASRGAAAMWLAPGRDIGLTVMVKSGFALGRAMWGLPRPELRLLRRTFAQADRLRDELVPQPHWYLQATGVDPQRQGQGLGTLLIRDGFDRADRDGVPVYLETETETNVRLYERLGFHVRGEDVADGLDLPFWLMLRDPPATTS